MTNNEILKASLLDIVFDNRNKQYGAYTLRKTYNQRMAYALMAAIGCTVALLAAGLYFGKKEGAEVMIPIVPDPVKLTQLQIEPEKPVPAKQPPAAPQPPAATKAFTTNIDIVKDNVPIENTMPPQEELISVAIGATNVDGDVPAAQQPSITENVPPAPTAPAEDNKVYDLNGVEEAAEFPGGQDAFQRFLAKHLQTPEDLRPGERRTVQVRFVIQKDGAVLDGAVLRSGGAVFDAEVLKVLRKLPRWKPTKQAGNRVAMAYMLPVTFVGSED